MSDEQRLTGYMPPPESQDCVCGAKATERETSRSFGGWVKTYCTRCGRELSSKREAAGNV